MQVDEEIENVNVNREIEDCSDLSNRPLIRIPRIAQAQLNVSYFRSLKTCCFLFSQPRIERRVPCAQKSAGAEVNLPRITAPHRSVGVKVGHFLQRTDGQSAEIELFPR